MNFSLVMFNMSFVFYILTLVYYKEYRKSLSIFLFILITIFFTPVIYYVFLNGQAYKAFNENSLIDFMHIATFTFFIVSIMLNLKNYNYKRELNRDANLDYLNLKRTSNNNLVKIYMISVTGIVVLYFLINIRSFPLYNALKFSEVIGRPDTTGNVPFYFFFSTILYFIIPGYYFYFRKKISEKPFLNLLILISLTILLLVGGNKGILVYLYIFIWINEYKLKINMKVIAMGIIVFLAYLILKTGSLSFNVSTIEYLATSPFRRFFVAQGSGFIVRLYLVRNSFYFGDIEAIKETVFSIIYNTEIGSSPTYFYGDLIVKYGIIFATILHIIVLSSLFFIANKIDKQYGNDLFRKWSFFSVLYLLGMAEISMSFVYRLTALLINFFIILFLERIRLKEFKH